MHEITIRIHIHIGEHLKTNFKNKKNNHQLLILSIYKSYYLINLSHIELARQMSNRL